MGYSTDLRNSKLSSRPLKIRMIRILNLNIRDIQALLPAAREDAQLVVLLVLDVRVGLRERDFEARVTDQTNRPEGPGDVRHLELGQDVVSMSFGVRGQQVQEDLPMVGDLPAVGASE